MSEEGNPHERPFNPRDLVAALVRRRTAAIITGTLCAAVAVSLALLLPPQYRSSGMILIEQQEVPVDLVRSMVSAYADQRLQVINQRAMTSQNLLGIVDRYQLYPDRGRATREELVQRMRADIGFKMISSQVIDPRSGTPRQATIAFSISYTSRDATKAAKVANELTTLYLNENLTERTRLAGNATRFLIDEGARLAVQIEQMDNKLAAFKVKNADILPELTDLNRSLLSRAEQELNAAEMRSMSLEQQRMFIETQLARVEPRSGGSDRVVSPAERLKMLRSQLASARALYAPEHPDIVRMEREIHGLEAQVGTGAAARADRGELEDKLAAAREELTQMRERYAADHPDVLRLERRVAGFEKQLKEASAAPSTEPADPSAASAVDSPDNPAYLQLQSQLAAVSNEQNLLKEDKARLHAQISTYTYRVAQAPRIEKEYREMLRDYESAYNKYREVRAKQMEAQVAQNLETDRKGERFTVIEPPIRPEKPVSPNRPAILAIGVVFALGATLAVVVLLEMLDTSVRGRNDLVKLLTAPPLAVLPWMETEREQLLRKRRQRRYAIAGAAATVLAAVGSVHLFYRPLDLLWLAVLRRLGV